MSTTLMPVMTAAPPMPGLEIGDPRLFRRARTWWMLFALFMLAQGNSLFTRQDDSYYRLRTLKDIYEPPGSLLLLTVIAMTIFIGLMVGHLGPVMRMVLSRKSVLAFAALPFLSLLWSQDPALSLRKATFLLLIVALAWFFATYYSPSEQMRLLVAAGVVVGLASIVMALLLPQYGVASSGEWKGVFGQKNRFGLSIFFLFASLPFRAIPGNRELMKVAVQALFPIGLILLSHSKTSLILMFVLIVVRIFGPFFARIRREHLPFLIFVLVAGVSAVGLTVAFGLNAIASLLGRDVTLTGRTEHWDLLFQYVSQHLWLGYGYQAFWEGATGDSGRFIAQVGAGMRGADSGYLDTLLQFGLVGMGMLLILLLVSVRDFLRLLRSPSVPLIACWYGGLILVTYVGDFTESLFWVPSGIFVFMFVLGCAGLRSASYESASFRRSFKFGSRAAQAGSRPAEACSRSRH